MDNFENVLKIVKEYGYALDDIVSNYQKSDNTTIIDNTLFYETITDGLLCLVNFKQNEISTISKRDVKSIGLMFDVSRGPVNTKEDIKEQFVKSALLGYTYVMLYTEDLFDIDIENFGYLRGKYTAEDIKELDSFANALGLELIACIQTLGHFENFLKWDKDNIYKDSDNVINVLNNSSIKLLKEVLSFCRKNFKSDKIHIGMDEATDLGRGYLLKKYGYYTQEELYLKHLKVIYDECMKLDYNEVIVWSDMLFTIDSKGAELYSNDINLNLSNSLKKMNKLKLCYWNYWSNDIDNHSTLIKAHYNFTNKENIICAGGVNQWAQLTYIPSSIDSFKALVESMNKEHLDNLLLTMWFDDAGYTNFNTTEYGIYQRAMILNKIQDKNNRLYEYIFKTDFKSYNTVTKIYESNLDLPRLLWDDPIKQIYLKMKELNIDELEHYLIKDDVSEKFVYSKVLINFTIKKTILALKLRKNNIDNTDIEEIKSILKEVKKEFRKYWLSHYKYNSMDLIQARYAILDDRFDEIELRLNNKEPFVELDEVSEVKITESFNDVFYQTKYRW